MRALLFRPGGLPCFAYSSSYHLSPEQTRECLAWLEIGIKGQIGPTSGPFEAQLRSGKGA